MSSAGAPPSQIYCGILKQVLSGDTVVIRDRPRGKAPEEWTCSLSGITAPRLARRPGAPGSGSPGGPGERDEPYAWDAREYLRKKTVGKDVSFIVEHRTPDNKRSYGVLYLGHDPAVGENLNDALVSEGLAEVRRTGAGGGGAGLNLSESVQRLLAIEDEARNALRGKFSEDPSALHVRNMRWALDNGTARQFVESKRRQPLPATVEHVRDGSSFRLLLHLDKEKNEYLSVQLVLTGVKAPAMKESGPDPYAEESKFFSEARLLQRNCHVVLEGENNAALVGTIQHPNGNIAELLLKEGLARCVDWTIGLLPRETAEKFRKAEREAKEKKCRMWKDYKGSNASGVSSEESVSARVLEVGNGDNVTVEFPDGKTQKYFLSSIRPPRVQPGGFDGAEIRKAGQGAPRRPLYDVPYMFEAREFLRKKLVGKKVNIRMDYVQPKTQEGFEERQCATVTVGEQNVAEALVTKGLAELVRYRADDENRSRDYDALLAAYAVAQKKAVGIHSKKDPPTHKVADLAGEPAKARQFLNFLKRAGRCEAVVEFVAAANRVRLYIPRETCLITVLCAGIEAPRAPRRTPAGIQEPGEPLGLEAAAFTKKLCIQREVEVEVDNCDKGGNFIGWIHLDGTNLSVALVEAGLAKVHFTAERTNCYSALAAAEDKARSARLGLWKDYVEPPAGATSLEDSGEGEKMEGDRKEGDGKEKDGKKEPAGREAVVSEVKSDLLFYVQYAADADGIGSICTELNSEFEQNPPLAGAITPKKGDLLAAQFSEDLAWYRARVLRPPTKDTPTIRVLFIDFGNEEEVTSGSLGSLPSSLASRAPYARAVRLAGVHLPPDEEDQQAAVLTFSRQVQEQAVRVAVFFEEEGVPHVTLTIEGAKRDVTESLLRAGLLVLNRGGGGMWRRRQELLKRYQEAQGQAKRNRAYCWRYGDFEEDDNL